MTENSALTLSWSTILLEAEKNWLSPESIIYILTYFPCFNVPISTEPPQCPSNGQIFLFNKEITKNYKNDGINWKQKKNQNRIQEAYDTFNIQGIELHRVNCRAAADRFFQRRIFKINQNNSLPQSMISTVNLVLVHYRLCSSSGTQHPTCLVASIPQSNLSLNSDPDQFTLSTHFQTKKSMQAQEKRFQSQQVILEITFST